jgi:hypothetical protein
MSAFPWADGFDLGEFLGIGLDTREIGYLAGALFLGLFGISALRRAKRAEGWLPIVWIAIAVGLFAGTLVVVARGFPDQIPESARSWIEPNRLVRTGTILALIGASLVCLSGHWVRGALARWICRVIGLVLAGVAVWLSAGWFAHDMPAEVRPWTADVVIERCVIVLALALLAGAFWVRQTWGTPHSRWANRAFAPVALAFAVILGWRWFGALFGIELDSANLERTTILVAALANAVCLLIAAGAYLLRERPRVKRPSQPFRIREATKAPARPLPVAVLLDDQGRPVLPRSAQGHSGPAGA